MSVGVRDGSRRVQAARGLYYGWLLVLTLGVTTIISYGTTYYLFGVLVVPVSHDVGWSRASISGAYALGTVLAGLLGVPIGRVVDRHGGRALMAAGSALTGLMLLGLAHVHALWQFYVLWVGGFALASGLTFYTVTFVVVANWFERRRGAALALLTLLGGLASPIFIPLAGTLIPRLGWRDTLMVLAVVQLGVALPLHALVVRRHPEDLGLRPDGADRGSPPASSPTTGLPLGRALRRTAFWTLTAAYALAMLASTVLLVHSVAYLIGRNYDAVLAADIVGPVGLASLPGRFILNVLSDRVGPQRLLGLCLVAQAVGVALLLHGTTLGWLAAYVLVYGAAFGAISPLRASVMADHFGRQAFGAITAVQGVPIALAGGVGPLAAGWLYDRVGNYGLAFWLCAGAFLLAGLGVLLTPQPPHDAHPRRGERMDTLVRFARQDDAPTIAHIYNQGIAERIATFETEPRSADTIVAALVERGDVYPTLVAERTGQVVAVAWAAPYRPRDCYAGIAEFSVYADRAARGTGAGRAALDALIRECERRGFWKLVSRIFPENTASRALCRHVGFREVGVYRRHAQLDGRWRDVVIVERLLEVGN